jgi:1-acyl-sn-glycerol-3-phosphate acyltransferase
MNVRREPAPLDPPADPATATEQQLDPLARFERASFELVHRLNTTPTTKRALGLYLRTFGAAWVYVGTRHLLRVHGLEELRHLAPDRSVLLVSNHRSFFDQYVISSVLFRQAQLPRNIYFPVRADFFYERPLGLFINALIAGFAMYPPIFRQPEKKEFNRYCLDRVVALLRESGNLVGIHPEGRRNKGDDPYTLLPAQPGVGKIVYEARPVVVPCFINGLGNDIVRQLDGNFRKYGPAINVVFGAPLDLDHFYRQPNRLAVHKRLADALLEAVGRLGNQERRLRTG